MIASSTIAAEGGITTGLFIMQNTSLIESATTTASAAAITSVVSAAAAAAAAVSTAAAQEDGYEFSEVSKVTLSVIISVVTILGLIGNTFVILIVLCFKDMHTVINFSFANLALTDLTLLILDAVPTMADTIGWNLSAKLGCNIPIYLQYVSTKVQNPGPPTKPYSPNQQDLIKQPDN